jgi:hypothetical protein
MVKLVDTRDLKSLGESCTGSTPVPGTPDKSQCLCGFPLKHWLSKQLSARLIIATCNNCKKHSPDLIKIKSPRTSRNILAFPAQPHPNHPQNLWMVRISTSPSAMRPVCRPAPRLSLRAGCAVRRHTPGAGALAARASNPPLGITEVLRASSDPGL